MSVVITGATGHLGRLVVENLLQQGVPAPDITATGRDTTKIKDLADRGVRVRVVDYDDPATLDEAFRGADRILLISASEPGSGLGSTVTPSTRPAAPGPACSPTPASPTPTPPRCAWPRSTRPPRRRCAPPAWSTCCCATAGTSRTTPPRSPRSCSAARCRAAPATAGSARPPGPTTRPPRPPSWPATGTPAVSTNSAATRRSPSPSSRPRSAPRPASPSATTTSPWRHTRSLLTSAGVPEPAAAIVADADRGLARGDLYVDSGHLRQLIGRPTTSLHDAVAAALH